MSSVNEVLLLSRHVNRREPIEDELMLFMAFSIILAFVPSINSLPGSCLARSSFSKGVGKYLVTRPLKVFNRVMFEVMRFRRSFRSSGSQTSLFHPLRTLKRKLLRSQS